MPATRSVPIHVYYPVTDGEIVLRTDADWESDLLPISIGDGSHFTFDIVSDKPFVYFKACLRQGSEHFWSVGENNLLIMDTIVEKTVYPHFFTPIHGSFSDLIELPSQYYDEAHKIRVFLPPGYDEKTLKRYPVLYMHDGNNLFLPEEASFGETWEVGEVLELMSSLRVTREVIVVGVWPVDRMVE